MFGERLSTPTDLRDECDAEPGLFVLVVLRRVIQFALGQFVEGDAHRSDPAARLAKHVIGGTA